MVELADKGMGGIARVLLALSCMGHAMTTTSSVLHSHSRSNRSIERELLPALAILLMAFEPAAAFHPSGPRLHCCDVSTAMHTSCIVAVADRRSRDVEAVIDSDDFPQDLNILTIAKLKVLLKARGLKVGGRKAELVARLDEFRDSQAALPELGHTVMQEKKPERRRDADGGIFTKKEFQDYYQDDWEEMWNFAEPADHIKLLSELNVGDTFEKAMVVKLAADGVSMDIGAEIDGFCHSAKIPKETWETVYLGDILKVTIDLIDMERQRVEVTTAAAPGEPVRDDMKLFGDLKVGDVFEDVVVQVVKSSGVVVALPAEKLGWLHRLEIPYGMQETLEEGSTIQKVTIKKIDPLKRSVHVTAKELARPITDLQVGEVVEGTIVNIMPFGAFVDFGCECRGLLHKSEISNEWVRDVSDKLSEGEQIKAAVKEIDIGRRHCQLTIKRMIGDIEDS